MLAQMRLKKGSPSFSSLARRSFFFCSLFLFAITPALAQVNNGGFESGFNNWTLKGDSSIQTNALGVNPIAGTNQAFMASATDGTINNNVTAGTGLSASSFESAYGLASGSLAAAGNGTPILVSGISQTVKVTAGQSIDFSYDFLTNQTYFVNATDNIAPSASNNDFAFMAVVKPDNTTSVVKLADTFSTLSITNATVPFIAHTGYHGYAYLAPQTGNYVVVFGVAHSSTAAQDNGVNSGLLIDSVYLAPVLTTVTVVPNSISGGSTTTGTVKLSGAAGGSGIAVSLSSNNGAATVPSSATVASGGTAKSFTINTTAVASNQTVTIKATLDNTSVSATLTVTAPTISKLTVSPTTIAGGPSSSTGTVTLVNPAPPGGALVTLSSNNAAATVGASTTVGGGTTAKSFTISTTAVATTQNVTISATYQGYTKNVTLTLNPGPITYVSVSPTSVKGGSSNPTGTVHLLNPAPTGGAQVSMASDNPSVASVPGTVTVAAAGTAKSFIVTTSAVPANTIVHISASYGGTTVTTTLTVTP